MKDHDHADLSAFVIAVHILGMYGLAPLVGRSVERIGRVRSIQVGAMILGLGTLSTVMAGYVPALMFFGLFFLQLLSNDFPCIHIMKPTFIILAAF